jgi:hypothetical protein
VGIGIWSIIATAAANIPWTKVVQSTPLLVDVFGQAKAKLKMNEASQRNVEDQLKMLHEENARLAATLSQLSVKVQLLNSRVATLTKLTVISLLCAISASVLWILK